MYIEYLKLLNFRNYEQLELRPGELNILSGDNAQGKTNATESVFLMAAGRSHRTSKDVELIRKGAQGAYVRVDMARGKDTHKLEMKILPGGRKQGKVDGCAIEKISDLIGNLNAVMFSPEDLRLVKDGPMERRRFMDMELSQVRIKYFASLLSYNRALSQRNALLKDMAAGKQCSEMPVFDAMLVDFGRNIITMRHEFMSEISQIAGELHGKISGNEKLAINYTPDTHEDELEKMLASSLQDDVRRGSTGKGPHKDDIVLNLNGSDLRSYGSQGQQRTAALSLKLSEIELMHNISGEWPVLILDDVLSELDDNRQKLLLKSIGHCQTFLTCTGLPKYISGGKVFKVVAGKITEG